ASRIATTSACAVGSLVSVTRLVPSATMCPSRTTSAANGPPPACTLASDSSTARAMKRRGSSGWLAGTGASLLRARGRCLVAAAPHVGDTAEAPGGETRRHDLLGPPRRAKSGASDEPCGDERVLAP